MSVSPAFVPEKGQASSIPLSKTCQNCFLLKIRCDRTQRTDICDRCARLGKHCVFRPARRRDNSAKRDSRIQALEAQVQQLLSTRTSLPSTTSVLSATESLSNTTASTTSPHASSSTKPVYDGDPIEDGIISEDKADTLVEMYRSDMMPHFPFVIIPPQATGRHLRAEKPFLFLAIISTASFHDMATQDILTSYFKYQVSERVLLGGDASLSLELLQGLLIVLAWNQYHTRSRFYSQYLQLAISIAVDLRLDRKPGYMSRTKSNAGSKRDVVAGAHGPQHWGPEEQRAAAGIFYLSSTISKLMDKLNTFPCTPAIEEGCLSLRDRSEYRSDTYLYHVIRLQRIIENVDSISHQSSTEVEAQNSFLRITSELEGFRAYLSTNDNDSYLLFMQFYTTKLFLYQVAFFERSLHLDPSLNLEILCAGLESAKSFLDLYLWLPPKSELALTNTEWIQLSFGVTLASKFTVVSTERSVEHATRDLRRALNLQNVFRHLILRIGALITQENAQRSSNTFTRYEARVKQLQSWFERISTATRTDTPTAASHFSGPHQKSQESYPYSQAGPPFTGAPTAPLPPQHTSPTHSHSIPPPPTTVTGGYNTSSLHSSPQNFHSTPQTTGGYSATVALHSPPQTTSGYIPYTPLPTLVFPEEFISDPGWQMPFGIPMESQEFDFGLLNANAHGCGNVGGDMSGYGSYSDTGMGAQMGMMGTGVVDTGGGEWLTPPGRTGGM